MPEKKPAAALRALYAQIEDVCRHFKEIRSEAKGIASPGIMPDATSHLNDVLQSTEEATTAILDAATAISYLAEGAGISEEAKQQIGEQVSKIYAACGFQDISGQRIKKVLEHLTALESRFTRLSETARGQMDSIAKDPLLNGPQLAAHAPSQEEIDKLFGTS